MAEQTTYRPTLVIDFFGDLLKRTMDAPTPEAHQHALQGFLEDLSPWLLPEDLPTLLGPAFQLFDACEFTPTADGTDENVAVVLSPPRLSHKNFTRLSNASNLLGQSVKSSSAS